MAANKPTASPAKVAFLPFTCWGCCGVLSSIADAPVGWLGVFIKRI